MVKQMRLVSKLSVIALAAFALSACSTTQGRGPVSDVVVPRPAPVSLNQPRVMVVNRENIDEFVALVQSGQIMVTMPLEEFNRIIENNQEVMVFMSNQDHVIDTYEGRITNTD